LCEGNKCIIKNKEDESDKITVFTAKWCGACNTRVPKILEKAKTAGLKVNLVDIDNIDPKYEKMAKRVQFVPYIDYLGHEIDEDWLDLLIQNKKTREEKLRKFHINTGD
jgi:glutaredoxin